MATSKEKEDNVNYVVYVKLPFNRGDFVDPPPVQWDEKKSDALWAHISGAQDEIRWEELAAHFNVTVQFLVQMAAFLTERHASQLRAQMRKIATVHGPGSNAPSPVPGAEPAGYPVFPTAEAMHRTGSASGRAPSALSVRKDSPLPRNEPTVAGPSSVKTNLPIRPQVSRNSSAGTTVPTTKTAPTTTAQRRRLPSLGISTAQPAAYNATKEAEAPITSPVRSTSPSSSSDESSPVQSRIIRRPPRFQTAKGPNGGHDDDDEAEPAFLPFQPQQRGSAFSNASSSGQDMGATVRGRDIKDFARRLPPRDTGKDQAHQSQTSDSSTSSAAMVPRRLVGAGPLSPRRTAELAGRSPSGKGKGLSREGSDGTPSMGSSFSDLDDASVTQSALEEALASRMQDGTIGSRMSTIGQAIRSRYLPGGASNRPREG